MPQGCEHLCQFQRKEAITPVGRGVKVVGVLAREKPMEYNPEKNPNIFKFYMKDNKGRRAADCAFKAKPQDFERTEQIVVTGSMKGEDFLCR